MIQSVMFGQLLQKFVEESPGIIKQWCQVTPDNVFISIRESATENIPPSLKVRVKRRGKSSPGFQQ